MVERALLMASGRSLFGIDVAEVREVLKAPLLHPVPLAPPGLLGAINLHDSVVPVLDFGLLHGATGPAGGQLVVLQESSLALAVDAVHGLSSRALVMPGGFRYPWVQKMFISSHGLAGLIDPAILLQTLEQGLASARAGTLPGYPDRIGG